MTDVEKCINAPCATSATYQDNVLSDSAWIEAEIITGDNVTYLALKPTNNIIRLLVEVFNSMSQEELTHIKSIYFLYYYNDCYDSEIMNKINDKFFEFNKKIAPGLPHHITLLGDYIYRRFCVCDESYVTMGN